MPYPRTIALTVTLLFSSYIPFIAKNDHNDTSIPKYQSKQEITQETCTRTNNNGLFYDELCKKFNHEKIVERRHHRRLQRERKVPMTPAIVEELTQKAEAKRIARGGAPREGQRRLPNTMMGISTLTAKLTYTEEEYRFIRKAINETTLSKIFPYANHTSFPCYPKHNNRPLSGDALRGIIYIRTPKASSSTLAGINLRIASHQHRDLCGTAWYHKAGNRFNISNRDKSKSLLWTFIR